MPETYAGPALSPNLCQMKRAFDARGELVASPTVLSSEIALEDILSVDLEDLCKIPLKLNECYQRRPATMQDLFDEVVESLGDSLSERSDEAFPHLVCISGNCRTGSTALTNLFGVAGWPAYYQPLKTHLRQRLYGETGDVWQPPIAAEHPFVAIKEMIGPYTLADCLFDPLKILTEAGYPRDRIHVVLLDRDPYECLGSWKEKWAGRLTPAELHRNFAFAAVNSQRLRDSALAQQIDALSYVYALTRWPDEAVTALFQRLGSAAPSGVTDWGDNGDLESDQSRVRYPNEPPAYRFVGLHSSRDSYAFTGRGADGLTKGDRLMIEQIGLVEAYAGSVGNSCQDLPISASVADGLQEVPLVGGGK